MTTFMAEGIENTNQPHTPATPVNAELSEKERRRRAKAMAKGRLVVSTQRPQMVDEAAPHKPENAPEEVQLEVFQGMLKDASSAEEAKEILLAFPEYAQVKAVAPVLREADFAKREIVRQAYGEVYSGEQLKGLDAFLGHLADVEEKKEALEDASAETDAQIEQTELPKTEATVSVEASADKSKTEPTQKIVEEEPKQESVLIQFLKKYVEDQEALRQIVQEESALTGKIARRRRVRPYSSTDEDVHPVKPSVEPTSEVLELQQRINEAQATAYAKWVDLSLKHTKLTPSALRALGELEDSLNNIARLKIRYQGATQRAIDAAESKKSAREAGAGKPRDFADRVSGARRIWDQPLASIGEMQKHVAAQRTQDKAERQVRELQDKKRREELARQRGQDRKLSPDKVAPTAGIFFGAYLERLDEELADDIISQQEFDKKKAAVKRIQASLSPGEDLDNEFDGGTFNDKEYKELKAYLKSAESVSQTYGSLEELNQAFAEDKISLEEFSRMKKELSQPQGA